MSRTTNTFVSLLLAAGFIAAPRFVGAQDQDQTTPKQGSQSGAVVIDGIAVRIDDDIISESEVHELAAYQTLVEGTAKGRKELLEELIDQWIMRREAMATNSAQPKDPDVNHAMDEIVSRAGGQEAFKTKLQELGIDEATIRSEIKQQEYLENFEERRFRSGIEVNDQQIEDYYNTQLVPKLEAQNQTVPPLQDVSAKIRELLIEQTASKREEGWISDARSQLRISMPGGDGCAEQSATC